MISIISIPIIHPSVTIEKIMNLKNEKKFSGYKVIKKSFSEVNSNLSEFLDCVTGSQSVVIIQQNGKEDVALIARSELDALMETIYLLKSPANAKRLLSALDRAIRNRI